MSNFVEAAKKVWSVIGQVGAVASPFAVVLVVAFGGYFWVDARYVHKSPDFVLLGKRLDLKIASYYVQQINARVWTLEDRLTKNPNDQSTNDELRRLREDKRRAEADFAALKIEPIL